ncbi:hypothetical protein O181_051709 [Austropuccinia psidii MF-1]|uniref:Uncharacterized protein n=1 Tax=Austropuccinia psidii MF-1 TaxID=1389203 RepID=A0A9Q3DZB6_9BASI|nr:hypothetical protein [Austropuccinia psidii MF-1]
MFTGKQGKVYFSHSIRGGINKRRCLADVHGDEMSKPPTPASRPPTPKKATKSRQSLVDQKVDPYSSGDGLNIWLGLCLDYQSHVLCLATVL